MRIALASVGIAVALGGCWTGVGEEYLQRSDTITLDAGNAPASNSVAHTITPWPRYVGDRRIPGNGARGVLAVRCYEERPGTPPIQPIYDPNRVGGLARQQGGGGSGGTNIQINQGQSKGTQTGPQQSPC